MSEFQGDPRSFAVDVENLKVIDIKKRLKALGLPVTGNKPELVERLQLALITGRDAAASPDSACDSSPSKLKDPLNKDSRPSGGMFIDLDQSQEVGQSEDLDESDNYEVIDLDQNQDEEVGESQDAQIGQIVSTTIVPSIKRFQPQEEAETVKPRKKIVLKRNNFPTPILATKVGKADEGEVSQSCDIAEKSSVVAGASTGSDKNVIKLSTTPYRGLSERDKQEKRAIRFNMSCTEFIEKSVAEIDKDKNFAATLKMLNKKKPYSRPQQNMPKTGKLSGIPAPSIDVLRKRAERFGENVSSVLKKLEVEEKLNQRKMKFGQVPSGTKDMDEEEKKKRRAERFGK